MARILLTGAAIVVLMTFMVVGVPLLRSMPETAVVLGEPSVLEVFEIHDNIGSGLGERAPEFAGISKWINSQPLTIEKLRGKVVLIDFWTYTCVNCIRTMPFLRDWQEKYADLGLVIVGVHTPEFEFEKNTDNVRAASTKFGLEYPIAQDNEFGTWKAFSNRFWPAKYLIDANGVVRYTHFGEGAYGETELAIRELLRETGARSAGIERNEDDGPTLVPDAVVQDPEGRITRELYGGWQRNATSNGLYIAHTAYYEGTKQTLDYVDPGGHINQFLFLHGRWSRELESIKHGRETLHYEDYIALKFFARSANIVIDLEEGVDPFMVKVTIEDDGVERALLPEEAGVDIVYEGGESFLHVDEGQMYFVVSLPDFDSRELRFASNSADFGLFAMTFGAYPDID